MVEVSAKPWDKNGIHMKIIKNEESKLEIWLRMQDIQINLGVKNISDLTIKEVESIYNRKRKNLTRQ